MYLAHPHQRSSHDSFDWASSSGFSPFCRTINEVNNRSFEFSLWAALPLYSVNPTSKRSSVLASAGAPVSGQYSIAGRKTETRRPNHTCCLRMFTGITELLSRLLNLLEVILRTKRTRFLFRGETVSDPGFDSQSFLLGCSDFDSCALRARFVPLELAHCRSRVDISCSTPTKINAVETLCWILRGWDAKQQGTRTYRR